jgi:hypothetical protein
MEVFTTETDAGATVTVRFMRLEDRYIYDQNDEEWKENAAACTTPDHSASEIKDMSDTVTAEYSATVNMANFNNGRQPKQFMAQFRSDGTILATDEFWVTSARRSDVPRILVG